MPCTILFIYSRAKSIASIRQEDVIPESPTEISEETDESGQNLVVNEKASRAAVNSPPPRPSVASNLEQKDIHIPVPTPTPTSVHKGKEEHKISKTLNENDKLTIGNQSQNTVPQEIKRNVSSSRKEQKTGTVTVKENIAFSIVFKPGADDSNHKADKIDVAKERRQVTPKVLLLEEKFKHSMLAFENIRTKMDDEDVIVDPIKLLEGEEESLKSADENGRDHYDEGFHSGELVNSEEDSNSIETLGSSEAKEEDPSKPARASTPMPRSNSFYKPGKMDAESKRSMAGSLKNL